MKKYKTVDEFMHDIDEKQKEQVTQLRSIITDAHPELVEHIKWKSDIRGVVSCTDLDGIKAKKLQFSNAIDQRLLSK